MLNQRIFGNFSQKRETLIIILKLEAFFNYFSSLHQDLTYAQEQESEEFCHNNDFYSTDCNFEELDKPTTVDEVEVVIRYLKRNKSFSGDQLLNEYFLESFDILLIFSTPF